MRVMAFALVVALGTPFQTDAAAQEAGDTAFLFAYRINPGQDAEFAEGYRRHLEWHAQKRDPLTWLGWTVLAGRGLGQFADGTFGVTLQAFDDRVDPGGDAADAARNVTAFADPVYRYVYRYRRDLGTSDRLEEGRPAAMQLMAWVKLQSGSTDTFVQALRTVRERHSSELEYAVYERLAGGPQPAFLLVVQFDRWAQLASVDDSLVRPLLRVAGNAITQADTEVWRYRPDLTYFPDR